jgi:hypothetical protein
MMQNHEQIIQKANCDTQVDDFNFKTVTSLQSLIYSVFLYMTQYTLNKWF